MMHVVVVAASFCIFPRNARIASAVLLSYVVCPSVDVTWGARGWTSSKVITRIISLGSSLLAATTSAI